MWVDKLWASMEEQVQCWNLHRLFNDIISKKVKRIIFQYPFWDIKEWQIFQKNKEFFVDFYKEDWEKIPDEQQYLSSLIMLILNEKYSITWDTIHVENPHYQEKSKSKIN